MLLLTGDIGSTAYQPSKNRNNFVSAIASVVDDIRKRRLTIIIVVTDDELTEHGSDTYSRAATAIFKR